MRQATMPKWTSCHRLTIFLWLWVLVAVGTAGFILNNKAQQVLAVSVIHKNTADKTSLTEPINTPLLSVVTAFSSNHLFEGVLMIRSLITQNYTGLIDVYLIRLHYRMR